MVPRKVAYLGFLILESTIITLVMCPNISVNAALQPFNFVGEVISIDGENASKFLQTDYVYPFGRDELVPYVELIPVGGLSVGDYVEIASLGSPDNYHTVAKLIGATNLTVTDISGDCRYIKTPLLGGYTIDYTMTPDLQGCTTRYCPAKYADIEITQFSSLVATRRLWPGETFYYQAEVCNITVTFHSGYEFNPDPIWRGWAGQQSPSVFTIHLTSENIPKNKLHVRAPEIIVATAVTLVAISAIMIMDFRKKRDCAGINREISPVTVASNKTICLKMCLSDRLSVSTVRQKKGKKGGYDVSLIFQTRTRT